MFELAYSRRAERELSGLNRPIALRILNGCKRLVKNPFLDGKHIKKLKGYKGLYRLRVGDYRILFAISGKVVQIIDVVSKKDFQKSY